MVTEITATEKEVPKTIPVPIGDISKDLSSNETCGCIVFDCSCYGAKNCSCSYPLCECAPTMISPTETEIIIVTGNRTVPQDYIYNVTREVPKIVMRNFTVKEAFYVVSTEIVDVPYLIEVNKSVEWPEITYVNTTEEYPIEVVTMEVRDIPTVI